MKVLGIVALALVLIGFSYALFLTLRGGHTLARYGPGMDRRARPVAYWANVVGRVAAIVIVLFALRHILSR